MSKLTDAQIEQVIEQGRTQTRDEMESLGRELLEARRVIVGLQMSYEAACKELDKLRGQQNTP